jgi:hypothetical protein
LLYCFFALFPLQCSSPGQTGLLYYSIDDDSRFARGFDSLTEMVDASG